MGDLHAALSDFADVTALTEDLAAEALRQLNVGWALTQLDKTSEALETIEAALQVHGLYFVGQGFAGPYLD